MGVFLSERKQQVILNRQFSAWKNASARVHQGSILGPLFLIYINDLTEVLSFNAKLFAYMSLFFVVNDIQTFANNLLNNKYLERIMATQ